MANPTNVETWWPSNDLERAMSQDRENSSAREHFFRTLMESSLYIVEIPQEQAEEGSGVLEPGSRVAILTVDVNSAPAVVAFTSAQAKSVCSQVDLRMPYISMKFSSLYEMIGRDAVVLNPWGPHTTLLNHDELTAIYSGMVPGVDGMWRGGSTGAKVNINRLANPPSALLKELSGIFRREKQVLKAMYCSIQFEADRFPHPLILVQTTGSWERLNAMILDPVNRWASEHRKPIHIADACDDSFSPHILKQIATVFYRRRWWRF
jgi:type III secretion system (T3SS) SseB-like protein